MANAGPPWQPQEAAVNLNDPIHILKREGHCPPEHIVNLDFREDLDGLTYTYLHVVPKGPTDIHVAFIERKEPKVKGGKWNPHVKSRSMSSEVVGWLKGLHPE